jgi:hypothetical protein
LPSLTIHPVTSLTNITSHGAVRPSTLRATTLA